MASTVGRSPSEIANVLQRDNLRDFLDFSNLGI